MFELQKEVRTYSVKAFCSECCEGEMMFDGIVLTSYPPQYPHTCNHCGHKENLRKVYPCINYKEITYD